MNRIILIALALVTANRGDAQSFPADPLSTRSVSGQFTASASKSIVPSRFASNDSISTDPGLLVISCERIKQSLYRKLDCKTSWQGRIHVHVHSARIAGEQPTILIENGLRGWGFRVELPDSIQEAGFVRTIVEALLMEIANRNANSHPAEVPMWLAEGLSQELIVFESATFSMPSKLERVNGLNLFQLDVSARRTNAVEFAKDILGNQSPMTFEQLSWPQPAQLFSGDGDLFRVSALLFVDELLRLKNGPDCLRGMLEELPKRYNWQFALLKGFAPHFSSLLDVEKWWALKIVQFTGRNPGQLWTAEESWRQLDHALQCSFEVRQTPTDLPMSASLTLQAVIRGYNYSEQTRVLNYKVQELNMARLRVCQDLVPLVQEYKQVLENYLREQKPVPSFFLLRLRSQASANRLVEETVKQLDALDASRDALRRAPAPALESARAVTAR